MFASFARFLEVFERGRCGRSTGPELGKTVNHPITSQINIWLVVSNMVFFSISLIWGVILSIDELHHFSRWLLHHQPDMVQGNGMIG